MTPSATVQIPAGNSAFERSAAKRSVQAGSGAAGAGAAGFSACRHARTPTMAMAMTTTRLGFRRMADSFPKALFAPVYQFPARHRQKKDQGTTGDTPLKVRDCPEALGPGCLSPSAPVALAKSRLPYYP